MAATETFLGEKYSLGGTCISAEDHQYIENVEIVLYDVTQKELKDLEFTNEKGVFIFNNLPKGEYYIRFKYFGKVLRTSPLLLIKNHTLLQFEFSGDL